MKNSKLINDFKSFAVKGNVMDLAVGVVIGGAFGKIVSSLVADVIMPVVGVIIGGINFQSLKFVLKKAEVVNGETIAHEVAISYGNFIQATFDFMIIAFAIFMFLKVITKMNSKKAEESKVEPATPAPTPEETLLLREIRDILKNK